MTEKKGGGAHRLEIDKAASLQDLEDRLLSFFFQGGKNGVAKLSRSQLTSYCVANFSECKLPSEVEGELFSVERYCKTIGSSPVRVYLLTEGDTEDDVDSENSDDGVHSLATRTPPGQKRLKLVRK